MLSQGTANNAAALDVLQSLAQVSLHLLAVLGDLTVMQFFQSLSIRVALTRLHHL